MIAQKHHIRAVHGVGDALAFRHVQRQAVVMRVHRYPAMKAHGCLGQCGVQRAGSCECERGGIRHVGVQHHRLAGNAVHRRVDEQGGRLHRVSAFQHVPVSVHQRDVVRLHLAPVQAARVEQKAVALPRRSRHRHAEMVTNPFAQAVVGCSAQGESKVGAQGGVLKGHVDYFRDSDPIISGIRPVGLPGRWTGQTDAAKKSG